MAGLGGVEPPHTEPESAVLPLYYSPLCLKWLGREDSNPRMHGPKPCGLPLADAPNLPYIINNGGEGGIRTLGEV